MRSTTAWEDEANALDAVGVVKAQPYLPLNLPSTSTNLQRNVLPPHIMEGREGVPAPHAHRALLLRQVRNGLAFTPSQNAPEGEQTLGYKTCANIPPRCPIRRLPR